MHRVAKYAGNYATVALVGLFVALEGCGGAESQPVVAPPAPFELTINTGDAQSAVAGDLLRDTLSVVVKRGGVVQPGVTVTWTPGNGEGSVAALGATNADGFAYAVWRLGTKAGLQRVVVASGTAGGLSASFSATAMAGPAAKITLSPAATTISALGDTVRLSATAVDQFGNAVANQKPQWSSSDPRLSVDSTGLARSTGRGTGDVTVFARVDSAVAQSILHLRISKCIPPVFVARGGAAGVPTFAEVANALPPTPPFDGREAAVADVDGDGRQDLVLFTFSFNSQRPAPPAPVGNVQVWRNSGQNTLVDVTGQVMTSGLAAPDFPRKVITFDANNDGRPDFFAAQHGYDVYGGGGAPGILLLSGAGGTLRNAAPTNLHPYDIDAFMHSAAAADVDCDGNVDLYEGTIANEPNRLLINQGAAVFVNDTTRMPADVQKFPNYASSEFCDVNKDGAPDLILGANYTPPNNFNKPQQHVILLNDGFGFFKRAPASAVPPLASSTELAVEVKCIDYDGDGWSDLVFSTTDNYVHPLLRLWHNRGNGTFDDVTATMLPQTWHASLPNGDTNWSRTVFIADMNGDGWPDIVASSSYDTALERIFLNRGAGAGFSEVTNFFDTAGGKFSLYPIDINSDGLKDLVAIPSGSVPRLMMLLNRGPR